MNKALLSTLSVAAILLLSLPAVAQVPERSVRVSVDTDFLRYQVGGWNPAGPEDWLYTSLKAGVGHPNAALGLGVTVVDAFTIGLRLSLGYEKEEVLFDAEDSKNEETSTNFDAMKHTMLTWGALPYLEYAFLQKTVRPFIMLMVGFEGSIAENIAQIKKIWDFVFGVGGGLHFFASPSVSVDATILIGFTAGGGTSEPPEPPEGEEIQKERFTRILFRASGILGVSGWF